MTARNTPPTIPPPGICSAESGGKMEDCAAYSACACDYRDVPPLTNYAFAAYAARIAHKSASWAADTLQTIPEDILDPIRQSVAARYLNEMRGLLDHIEKQVKP